MNPLGNRLTFTWLTFLAGGTFFVLMVPLGEGFDEPWHFAYVQHVAQFGKPPLGHSTHISEEIATFLRVHPVSWGLHRNFPTLLSHDEYWRDQRNRDELDPVLANLRFSGEYAESQTEASGQYESHQPPLYYFASAPVFAAASYLFSFVDTFLAARMFSVFLASLIVPGSFLLAKVVLKDSAAAGNIAALVVLFPGLYPGVVRVSNDALAVPLACWTLVLLALFLEKHQPVHLYGLSALLIAGLWTKAFFIPILAGVIVSLLYYVQVRAAITVLLISLAGAPWYVNNFNHTGSITGLPETISIKSSAFSSVEALWGLDWNNLLNVVRFSHIWVGNWSFLSVRSWMYRVVFWLFVLGVMGLIRGRIRSVSGALSLIICYAVFIAGLIYYATQVFQETGTSVAEGWYLTSFIPAEAVLFSAGLQSSLGARWRWVGIAAQVLLLALLIYSSAFIAMPYYSGITAHKADGHLATYHPQLSDFGLMSARLLRFHPFVPVTLPWLLLSVFPAFAVYSINNLLNKR